MRVDSREKSASFAEAAVVDAVFVVLVLVRRRPLLGGGKDIFGRAFVRRWTREVIAASVSASVIAPAAGGLPLLDLEAGALNSALRPLLEGSCSEASVSDWIARRSVLMRSWVLVGRGFHDLRTREAWIERVVEARWGMWCRVEGVLDRERFDRGILESGCGDIGRDKKIKLALDLRF